MSGAPHYSVGLEPDDEGWFHIECNCGAELGVYPTAEDGCDALMDHAYQMGMADGMMAARMLEGESG